MLFILSNLLGVSLKVWSTTVGLQKERVLNELKNLEARRSIAKSEWTITYRDKVITKLVSSKCAENLRSYHATSIGEVPVEAELQALQIDAAGHVKEGQGVVREVPE